MDVLETEVLVVGAGPVGVTLGLLLADLGVSTVVIDKRTTVSQLPRARGLNARGAEILRMVGAEDDMVRHALPVSPQMQVRQDLAHPPALVVPTGGETFTVVSPCEGIAISQDVLESVLREHLEGRTGVELRAGYRLASLGAGAEGTLCRAVAVDSDGRSWEVRSRFVVGADGWRSDVRSLLGIDVVGPEDLGQMRSVRFAADLTHVLGDPPPAFIQLTGVDGVLLATHADGRWVLIVRNRPGLEPDAEALVATSLGTSAPVTVLDDNRWTAAVQQAARFRQENVFLAGDAAHRVTPAGATGITSGMADSANLAWKLAAALHGWGGPRLLESYRQEREPVASWIGTTNTRIWTDFQQGRQTAIELRWLEFGYRYSSPIISPVSEGRGLADIDLASTFSPSAQPGDRAPHARLEDGRSTIDLTGHTFTLLSAGNHEEWSRAAAQLGATLRLPLTAVRDSGDAIRAAFELANGESVLIRPDGHIAWRSDSQPAPRSTAATLEDAVRLATGW